MLIYIIDKKRVIITDNYLLNKIRLNLISLKEFQK